MAAEARLSRNMEGFLQRQAAGFGTQIGPEEIARRSAVRASDLLVSHPGFRVQSRSVIRRPQLVRLLCGSASGLSKIVGNEGNVAAFEPDQEFAEQAFYNNTLEPPPCPRHIYDVLYETGHGN